MSHLILAKWALWLSPGGRLRVDENSKCFDQGWKETTVQDLGIATSIIDF